MNKLEKLMSVIITARETHGRVLSELGFDQPFRNLERFAKQQAAMPMYFVRVEYETLGGRPAKLERAVPARNGIQAMEIVEHAVKKRKRFAGKINSHAVKVKKVA